MGMMSRETGGLTGYKMGKDGRPAQSAKSGAVK